jgi:hypothetical protein
MIGHDVVLVLAGMAAGVLACLATGVAVRVALGGRSQPMTAVSETGAAVVEASGETEIAIAMVAVSALAKLR